MTDWFTIDSPPGYEAWAVLVAIDVMPDGTVAAVGLRLEPRDGRTPGDEQRITSRRLANFPIGHATMKAAAAAYPEGSDGEKFFNAEAHVQLLEGDLRRMKREIKKMDSQLAERERHQRAARAAEVGEQQEILEHVASLWRLWHLRPSEGGYRTFIAEEMNKSLGWVDLTVGKCRKAGLIPAYKGAQGTYGKEPKKTSGKKPGTTRKKKGQQP